MRRTTRTLHTFAAKPAPVFQLFTSTACIGGDLQVRVPAAIIFAETQIPADLRSAYRILLS